MTHNNTTSAAFLAESISLLSGISLKRLLCLQINVSDIVKEMRRQRHGMIQTKVSVNRGGRSSKFTL